MSFRFHALVFAALIAFPPSYADAKNAVTRTIPVDNTFEEWSLEWRDKSVEGADTRFRLIAVEGVLELCGALAYQGNRSRSAVRKALRNVGLTINDKVVIKDFTFFATVASATQLPKAKANCARTASKVPKGQVRIGLDMPRRGFRLD